MTSYQAKNIVDHPNDPFESRRVGRATRTRKIKIKNKFFSVLSCTSESGSIGLRRRGVVAALTSFFRSDEIARLSLKRGNRALKSAIEIRNEQQLAFAVAST